MSSLPEYLFVWRIGDRVYAAETLTEATEQAGRAEIEKYHRERTKAVKALQSAEQEGTL